MSKNKELKPHLDYIEDCLGVLKDKVNQAKQYLRDIPWAEMTVLEDREKEFKFQATLVDKYTHWINEYARLSGVIDAFKELDKTEEKEVRKGSSRSAFAQMIKDGELE